jgi:signal transduction histidine kinase
MEESSGLRINLFFCDVPERIDHRNELALFRIAQEAVNNAIKHSGAEKIHINLTGQDHSVSLSIEDDGHGFNYDEVSRKAGGTGSLGLVLMRERAFQVSGTLQVDSRIGYGTYIVAEIPIEYRERNT